MNDKVSLLLHKRWTGQISPEELSQLEALLSSDPGLRKEAAEMESIWAKAAPLATPGFVPNPDKEWVRFKKDNMDGGAKVVSKPPRILGLLPFGLVGKAAAAVSLLVMSYMAVQFFQSAGDGNVAVLEETNSDQESVQGGLMLPDSSVVWINGKSSFQYPKSFDGEERRVILDGEAHFQVRKDATRPFIVQTPNGEVRVLGTSFNVNAHSSGKYEIVYVESGVVAFKAKESNAERMLEEGDAARLKKSTLQFVPTFWFSSKKAMRWKREALNFRDTPVKDILDALERHYSMRFDRSGIQEDILKCQITISFVGASEETVIKYLETKTSMKVVSGAKPYTHRLTGGRCEQ